MRRVRDREGSRTPQSLRVGADPEIDGGFGVEDQVPVSRELDRGLLVLKSGERAIRFRPALDITSDVVDEALNILDEECRRLCK